MAGSPRKLESHTWGALPVVNEFFRRLGIDEALEKFLPRTDRRQILPPARAIGVLVRNLIISRRPLYALSEWGSSFEGKILNLSGNPERLLNDDRIGRALDRLFDVNRQSLVMEIVVKAVKECKLKLKELHNDSTTVTFHGAYREADGRPVRGKRTAIITYGHNKDHRPDLKQLLWELTITSDGAVPVHYHVWDGNTTDNTTHQATWEVVRELVGHARFLYVSDCKLCSGKMMRHIDKEGGRFLTVMPQTRKEEKDFRKWMQDHKIAWEKLMSRPNIRGKGYPRDVYQGFESPVPSAEGFRIVWIHTSEKEKRDAETRREKLSQSVNELEELNRRLSSSRCRLRTRERVDQAVDAALRNSSGWIDVTVKTRQAARYRQEKRGRPGPQTRYQKLTRKQYTIEWKVNEEKVQMDARTDGVFPLITNNRKMSMKDLLVAYKRQPDIEKRHEQLKNTHDVAPQYLKSPARIEALLCAYFIALLANAIIERELRRAMKKNNIKDLPLYPEHRSCKKPTMARIMDLFEKVQVHRLRQGSQVKEVFGPELSRLQRKILKLLGVPIARYSV